VDDVTLALVVALSTAGGAGIGGTIGAGTTVWLDRKRDARRRGEEERRQGLALRRAARMVVEELVRNKASANTASAPRDGFVQLNRPVALDEWRAQKSILASVDDPDVWFAIASAYAALGAAAEEDGRIEDNFRAPLIEACERAISALVPYA
jgi:hypothetical protein